MTPTNWLPGIIALAVALLGGGGYALWLLSRTKASALTDAAKRAADLDAQYRLAIQQLRELKAEQHHLTPEAYAAQRAELEHRAAEALRARDAQAPAIAVRPANEGFFARRPQLVGALWGGGVVGFFGLLGLLLFFQAKPDPARGSMGSGPMQSQGPGPDRGGPDELDRAMEHLSQHPEDTEAASMVGHELIRRQQWEEAFQVTERALGADPFHLENRIHRAWMRSQRGDPAAGAVELQHLADTYPGAQEALLFLASMRAQMGDKARALDALERYVTVAPPEEQSIELYQAMAQFRRELGKPPAP